MVPLVSWLREGSECYPLAGVDDEWKTRKHNHAATAGDRVDMEAWIDGA